jgi:hypothetical protein
LREGGGLARAIPHTGSAGQPAIHARTEWHTPRVPPVPERPLVQSIIGVLLVWVCSFAGYASVDWPDESVGPILLGLVALTVPVGLAALRVLRRPGDAPLGSFAALASVAPLLALALLVGEPFGTATGLALAGVALATFLTTTARAADWWTHAPLWFGVWLTVLGGLAYEAIAYARGQRGYPCVGGMDCIGAGGPGEEATAVLFVATVVGLALHILQAMVILVTLGWRGRPAARGTAR